MTLPELLYPVEQVYKDNGFEIPDLPAGTVALVNGEYILKKDYQSWVYRKIGFDSKLRETFVSNRNLKDLLQARGVNTALQKELFCEYFDRFEMNGIFTNCADWVAAGQRALPVMKPALLKRETRIEEAYLGVLYILENWREIHARLLKVQGVKEEFLNLAGDDEYLTSVVELNNAYQLWRMYPALIRPYIHRIVLDGENLNLPGQIDEFTEWLYTYYNSIFLLENYLGVLLSAQIAETRNLQISEAVIQEEMTTRIDAFNAQLKKHNRTLPKTCTPLEISPAHKQLIMQEIRDDLYKSKVLRARTALNPHEIRLRFYDKYGFEGQRCEVREIFRWIKKRRLYGKIPEYPAYAAAEQARVRAELEAIRSAILDDGTDSFYTAAMTENYMVSQQMCAGRVDVKAHYGMEVNERLSELELNEISPVLQGSDYSLDLFWLAEVSGTNRVYHRISKLLTLDCVDFLTYDKECAATQAELEDFQDLVESGASLVDLAEEHSDSFDLNQGDVSETYQSRYGLSFAKEVNSIPDGGLKIIESENGLHLVQVLSREYTPYTDEIQSGIVQRYNDELAPQDERYEQTKALFFQSHPYFK